MWILITTIPILFLISLLFDKNYKGWSISTRVQSVYWQYWQSPHPGSSGAIFKATVLGIFWLLLACSPIVVMCLYI